MVAFGFWDSHISLVTMLLVTEIVHRGFPWKDSFLHEVDPVAVSQVNRASRDFSKHVKLLMSQSGFQKDMLNQRPPLGIPS